MDRAMEPVQTELASKARRPRHQWLPAFMVLLAFLVWETTAIPALVALVVCFKFGLKDWSMALWLIRHDPEPKRGIACGLFHAAFGLWKVGASATLLILLAVLSGLMMAKLGQKPMLLGLLPILKGAAGAVIAGFGLTFMATYIAIIYASLARVRVWLGESSYQARRAKHWPPRQVGRNMAPVLSFTTMIITLMVSLTVGVTFLGNVRPGGIWQSQVFISVAIFGLSALMAMYQSISKGTFARCVYECWPYQPDEMVHQVEMPGPAQTALEEPAPGLARWQVLGRGA